MGLSALSFGTISGKNRVEDLNSFRWTGWRMLFRGIGDDEVMALLFLKVDFQGRLRFDGKEDRKLEIELSGELELPSWE